METYHTYMALSCERRRTDLEKVEHNMRIKEALYLKASRPWSKILVKLAGIMISAGEKLKSSAEKDLQNCYPAAS